MCVTCGVCMCINPYSDVGVNPYSDVGVNPYSDVDVVLELLSCVLEVDVLIIGI